MKEIAIIGPTASGKSDLAIEIALQCDANILSLDSLSIYKEIDIVSAKPSKEDLTRVKHFGIDEIYPNERFNAQKYIELYQKVKRICQKEHKNLIIVGGSSFYLKALIQGLSQMPNFSKETQQKVKTLLQDRSKAFELLKKIDPLYATSITKNDQFRIQKGLLIYFETSLAPSDYFQNQKPLSIASPTIFEIAVNKEVLKSRIEKRTKKMIKNGLIDEIIYLEKRYTRNIQPIKAIGIKETLEYLDGKIKRKDELIEAISKNTRALAKRQITFNKTQFHHKTTAPFPLLKENIKQYFYF